MAGPIFTNYTLLESSKGAVQFDVGPEGAWCMGTRCNPPRSATGQSTLVNFFFFTKGVLAAHFEGV